MPSDGDEHTAIACPLAGRYAPGTIISSKYRLEALLGEGGMGAVWRAENVLLDLPVALKLIRADLDRGALRARLQLEARSAAKLGHPAIVRVYDVGESELGDPFIVMEHLRGETLAKLIARGPLPASRAVQLLLPIIDALAVAHARGIVHRDLKPDNLMIALEEQHVCPKILDFGIAKLTAPGDADQKLTAAGAVVGSPEYMSPEQARGLDDVDASTDIWSICVVLYEAVAGYPPFRASNCNALLRSIVEDAPKPFPQHSLGDAELWQLVERGLHKDRAQRYPKIFQLGQALAAWLSDQGVSEDACGSSLDSKWLGRRSDPLSSNRAAATVPDGLPSLGQDAAVSNPSPSPPQRAPDSSPNSSGTARGTFSKTILPSTNGRTRTLGLALAAGALLTVSLLAFGPPPRANARAAFGAAVANASSVRAPAALPSVPAPIAVVAHQAEPPSGPPPEAKAEKPSAKGRLTKPFFSPIRPQPSAVSPVSSSAPRATPKPERPLDLLTPY